MRFGRLAKRRVGWSSIERGYRYATLRKWDSLYHNNTASGLLGIYESLRIRYNKVLVVSTRICYIACW